MRIFTYNTNPITNQKWLIIGFMFLALSLSSLHAQITLKVTQDTYTDNTFSAVFGDYPTLTAPRSQNSGSAVGMSNYTNNTFGGTTIVNYIGEMNSMSFADAMAALKFTLPPSAGILASVKLRLKIVDVGGSPIVTIRSTDDIAWVQENTTTSYFALLTNPTTLVSSASINAGDAGMWKEFDVTSYVSSKMEASSTIISMMITGNDNSSVNDNYFTFVADDNLADLTGGDAARNTSVIYDANAEVAQLVLTYATAGVTTQAVSSIAATTATGNGNVTSLGTSNPTAYGVCWNTGGTPTTSDSKVNLGAKSATGAFTASMTGLSANTTYHVRSFVTNPSGTTYGDDVTFTTLAVAPTVTTQAVSNISVSTATGNGNITSLGIPNPTAYGVCWNTGGSPTISDSKADNGAASATGAFIASITGLSANTTYHVRAYATNTANTSYGSEVTFTTLTPGTWTGNANSSWTDANNWAGAAVPTSATDVIISSSGITNFPVISSTETADCHNLTLNNSLTISNTGSLIVHGTTTGTGYIEAELYLTANKWHIISPIASGQNVANFLTANANIATKTGSPDKRGLMDYNTADNKWNDYYLASGASGTMDAGKGYSARISDADGTITFTGNITSGDYQKNDLITTGEGWNCIGNPYTSAIGVNADAGTDNFLKTNATVGSSNLDPAYACLYLWNGSEYKILGNLPTSVLGTRALDQDYIAPGQGFFVKAASGVTSVSFTSAMQSHQNAAAPLLKSAKASWPTIQLNIAKGETTASTIVAFNSDMTKGLDPTYDAGLLRGTTGVNLYSRLVDDNGIDFAIQALPSAEENLVIPIGVESKDGGNVTFSAKTVELPANTSVVIEDKTTGTLTSLTDGGVYTATVEAGVKGIGRFYLHTKSASTTTDVKADEAVTISAYANNKTIYINGKLAGATAQLFDINGKQVDTKKLTADNASTLEESKLVNGVYVLRVISVGKVYSFKVVLQ